MLGNQGSTERVVSKSTTNNPVGNLSALSQLQNFKNENKFKELYDEFFDACFKLDYYSYESYKKYFDNNISHFNNLLKNELKLRK